MVQDASQLAQGAQQAVAPAPVKVKSDPSVLAVKSKSTLVGALYFAASMGILLAFWVALQKSFAHDLPTPAATFAALKTLLANPYFVKSDGTMGIINLVYASLVRVFIGFGLGSIIAIPLGVLMGSSDTAKRLIDPISQVMRPVSPLAWFPLAQVVFLTLGQGAMPAAIIGTIAITCLWPTLVNTAVGVASLPADYATVAKVFQFSKTRYLTKVLLPYSLPHIVTGLRLSMGIAWLVIVAAEMLSGASGIGFSAFDAYNQGRLDDMMATIIVIGAVGLILDKGFDWMQRKLSYEDAPGK